MTSNELTALALKILAIWLLVHVVLYLPNIVLLTGSFAGYTNTEIPLSLTLSLFLGFLIVGLTVAVFLLRLSKSVLAQIPESQDQNTLTPTVALQITGLFFMITALGTLPAYVLSVVKQPTVPLSSFGYIAGYVFEIAVGVYLLIKPSVWVHWLRKLRG